MGRIFISYSHKDKDFVYEVNNFLRDHDILAWLDRNDIKASDHWDKHIKTAIYSSDVFLMFYSRNYLASPYCKKEFEIAKSKGSKSNILIVGLDRAKDSLKIHDEISAIQRVNYDYLKDSVDDLNNELMKIPSITRCKLVNNEEIKGEQCEFLDGISKMDNITHHVELKLLIQFLIDLKELSFEGKHVSNTANFSSLAVIKNFDESRLKLICESDFSKTEDNTKVFIKNVLLALFNFEFRVYDNTPDKDISFNEIYEGNEIYDLFNSRISEIYKNIDKYDGLELFNYLIRELSEVYNASLYYEDISYTRNHNHTKYSYEVNELLLEVVRRVFLSKNEINTSKLGLSLPDIIDDKEIIYRTDDKSSSLEKLVEAVDSKDKKEKDLKEDIFIYGDEKNERTGLLLDYFNKHHDSFYIDLNKYANRYEDSIIKRALMDIDDRGYKLDYDSLHNYSTFVHPVVLLIDNFDYIPREKRNVILDEIPYLELAFKIVLTSSKRNVEENVALDDKVSALKYFTYNEVLSLTKVNIITYLTNLGIKEELKKELEELEEDDNFFKFFNSFEKLNVLFSSIKDIDNFSISEIKNDINSEIKVYQMIYESKSDYSVSKHMADLFKDTVVPIGDVIMNLVIDEINKLKEISYNNKLEDINKLRFREFGCVYSILSNNNENYQFLNEDIRSYFVASYIVSKMKANKASFDKVEELLKPVYKDYRVLKYINAFDVFDYIELGELFKEENKDKYLDLKYSLFKISQYNKDSRKLFSTYCDLEEIPDGFLFGAENISVVSIPKSIRVVGRAAFTNMSKLTKLLLLSNASELVIKPWAIINCPNLKTIKLGSNYKKFNAPLISQCKDLEEIIVKDNNEYFATLEDNKMLVSKDYKTLYLSLNSLEGNVKLDPRIEVLESNCLSNLDNLESIFISKNVTSIDTNFTDFDDKLVRIDVDRDNKHYYSDELGYLYEDKEGKKCLFRVPSGIKDDISIPRDVKIIGSDSISTCSHVKNIFVPSSVKIIENYAFADTNSLMNIYFEEFESDMKVENYIFLSTNASLNINILDEEEDDGNRVLTLDEFNNTYNRATVDKFKVNIKENKVDMSIFEKEGFEIISDSLNSKSYSKIVILRAINIFENLFTYDENDFNILMIGMTEYNAINMKGSLEMEKYIDELITSRHISLIVFTRDLPMIETLYKYKDRVSIIRTSKGSTYATRTLIELLNKGEKLC